MCATEDDCPIVHLTGRALVELIASNTIGLVITGKTVVCAVIFTQSVQGAYPDIPQLVFLNSRYIGTGGIFHSFQGFGCAVVSEQSVGNGPDPDVTHRIFIETDGNECGSFDLWGYIDLFHIPGVGIDDARVVGKRGDHDLSRGEGDNR